ncbi:MAG: OadG family protein [Clostridia bacterium]
MELLSEGLAVTVIGISTVFAVLILLWGLLELMRIIFYKEGNKSPVTVAKQEIKTESVVQESIKEMDEDELVAVLTAAVASSLNQSTYNLNIQSFRRIDQQAPVWNSISRKEQLENRL